jgi:cell division septation protein DedD
MDRETPRIERAPARRGGTAPVATAADPTAASMLVSSLRRRPGHVVITAPFTTTAGRLFEMAEPQLGTARIVRLSARLLVESEIARAIVGVTQRGLPPPAASVVAEAVEEERERKRIIILLVEDADAIQIERLERIRAMLSRTPAMREVVRLVLLGSGQLLRLLGSPAARPFADALALHLNVAPPEPVTLGPAAATADKARTRRRRAKREPPWLLNEKLLVLAVGAVLVTGVLLFPIQPTVYPPRAADRSATAQPAAGAEHAPAPAPPEAPPAAPAPPATEPAAATAPTAPAPPATTARFRPPATPGPALQVGAFRDRENAVQLAERLAREFDGVYIDQLGEGDASLHRVRVPIPHTVLGETTLAHALKSEGFEAVRVE